MFLVLEKRKERIPASVGVKKHKTWIENYKLRIDRSSILFKWGALVYKAIINDISFCFSLHGTGTHTPTHTTDRSIKEGSSQMNK